MIPVTRLNGKRLILNAEIIRYVESTPDTMITLTTGDKIIVKETLEKIVQLAIEYQRQIRPFQT